MSRSLDDVTMDEWTRASRRVLGLDKPKPAPASETDIMKLAMIELSRRGHVVFRANVGLFYTKDGRPQKTGLPVGFPDTFGSRHPDNAFFAVEFKKPGGRLRPEQRTTLNALRARGIRAGVAYSIEDAIRIVESDAISAPL